MTPLFVVPPICSDRFGDSPGNRLTSALEVAEFCEDPPDRYTAYLGARSWPAWTGPAVAHPDDRITTWMGDPLGSVLSWGRQWRSNMGDTRRSFRMRAINGHVYSGVSTNAHDLVRLRRVKG